MISRLRKLLAIRNGGDALAGDFVRVAGRKGVGFVDKVNGDGFAWVSLAGGRLEYLPLGILRPVKKRAESFDRKGPLK